MIPLTKNPSKSAISKIRGMPLNIIEATDPSIRSPTIKLGKSFTD